MTHLDPSGVVADLRSREASGLATSGTRHRLGDAQSKGYPSGEPRLVRPLSERC